MTTLRWSKGPKEVVVLLYCYLLYKSFVVFADIKTIVIILTYIQIETLNFYEHGN
jgi:hypothetical protein